MLTVLSSLIFLSNKRIGGLNFSLINHGYIQLVYYFNMLCLFSISEDYLLVYFVYMMMLFWGRLMILCVIMS